MTGAPRLLAITPGDGRDLRPWIEAMGAAGLPAILIREPTLPRPDLEALVAVAVAAVPRVIVHDRHPAARDLGLPIHLPASSCSPDGAFSQSCHRPDQIDRALAAGAAFVLWSPVWSPTSKAHDHRRPLGLTAFLAGAAGRPILALGGLDPARYRRVRAGGGAGAAVLGDLFRRSTPEAASAQLARYLRWPRPTAPAGPCRDRR